MKWKITFVSKKGYFLRKKKISQILHYLISFIQIFVLKTQTTVICCYPKIVINVFYVVVFFFLTKITKKLKE